MDPTPNDFDAKARTWDQDQAKVERAGRVASAIVREVPDLGQRRILDYGCGTGLLGFALAAHGATVTFADTSGEMLSVVREKLALGGSPGGAALELDLSAGGSTELRFDLACSLMALHHIPDTDDVLARFAAILHRGGALCLADLDREDGSFHGAGFDGHCGFDRADLGARMERAGFTAVRFSTVLEFEKGAAGTARRYPIFLAVGERA